MSAALYREFPLRSPAMWPALVAFVKANWQACQAKGTPLRIIVTSDEKTRTSQQNRYFHGPFLNAMAEQAWWNGQQYPQAFWKEYLRRRFLLKDEYITPDGEVIQIYWSTADLSAGAMAEFMNKAAAEAASEWGVVFE